MRIRFRFNLELGLGFLKADGRRSERERKNGILIPRFKCFFLGLGKVRLLS